MGEDATHASPASILRPVAKHWFVALTVFVLCSGCFIVFAVLRGYTYVASASLFVTPPAYQSQAPGFEFLPLPLDTPTYAKLLKDDAVLQQVCERLYVEDRQRWGAMHDAGKLIPNVIARMLTVETQVAQKTPQRVIFSNRIALRAKCSTPEQTKHLLDTWLEVSVRSVQDFGKPGMDATVTFIKREYEKAKTELEAREDLLCEQQANWNVTLLERRKAEKEDKLTRIESALLDAAADVVQAASELADVRMALETEDEKSTLRRFSANNAVEVLGAKTDAAAQAISPFTEEVLNDVYTDLKTREGELSSKLKGAEVRRETLATQAESLREDLDVLSRNYVEHHLVQVRLQRDVDALKGYFDALAKQREEVAMIEAHSQFKRNSLITPAGMTVMPSVPHGRILRWSLILCGFCLGIVSAIGVTNVLYELRRTRERRGRRAGRPAADRV